MCAKRARAAEPSYRMWKNTSTQFEVSLKFWGRQDARLALLTFDKSSIHCWGILAQQTSFVPNPSLSECLNHDGGRIQSCVQKKQDQVVLSRCVLAYCGTNRIDVRLQLSPDFRVFARATPASVSSPCVLRDTVTAHPLLPMQ
jgi:hypothetical protein